MDWNRSQTGKGSRVFIAAGILFLSVFVQPADASSLDLNRVIESIGFMDLKKQPDSDLLRLDQKRFIQNLEIDSQKRDNKAQPSWEHLIQGYLAIARAA